MSNLLASLRTSANALDVIQQALSTVQNNVTNASTPGYASQQLRIVADPFNLAAGTEGGVSAKGLISSRNDYADTAVQSQLQSLGYYTAQSQSTGSIQSLFDPSGSTGVINALNNLLTSFSAWSASPSDAIARQQVIANASALAGNIQGLSAQLQNNAKGLNDQVDSTTKQINDLAGQIQQYNVNRLKTGQDDPGADAQLHSALENLSQLVNFTALTQSDGTVTVLAGGSEPLVIGQNVNALSSSDYLGSQPTPVNPQAPPTAHIIDSAGKDVTSEITGGQLGGLLDSRNRVLASIIGDGQQAGSLNVFAKTLADTVNNVLQSGTVTTQPGAANGAALFTYNSADATLAAGTFAVNPVITPDQLASVDSSGNASGNAQTLANLGSTGSTQGLTNGHNLVTYLAGIAAAVGHESSIAQSNQQLETQAVSDARTTRDQISGVSLDSAAAEVLQLQRGYQAVSRVLTVVNSLADSILNLVAQ